MKVAVTGGTGFLGRFVVEQLKKSGHEATIFSRSLTSPSKEVRKTDYTFEDLKEKLNKHDAIIHLAAKRGSQGKKIEFQDNEILTQNLYDAAVENNITNIVYASTISVYSGKETLPWSEQNVPNPPLMYGVSKLTCEMIGNLYNQKHNMAIKNLRLAHLYGPNEKNNYMINLFFRQAYNHETLKLSTSSTAKREFLYVKDAAAGIVKAMEAVEKKGTFNIGSDIALTNEEVGKLINEVFHNEGKLVVQNPHLPDKSVSSFMNNQLGNKELGFTPKYSFKESLSEIFLNLKEQNDVPIFY